MMRLELTFMCDVAEETLDVIREQQETGDFGVDEALAVLQDARPDVRLMHVGE